MFGMSFVYVLFDEGTDLYWARSRVNETLSRVQAALPEGARSELGPDATGIGWVFQYALVDRSGQQDLASMRTLQDFHLRYALESVPGVAQVASIGGYQKQYQVTVDPERLRAFGLGIQDVADAVRRSNGEVGAGCSSSAVASISSAGAATSRTCPTSATRSSGARGAPPSACGTSAPCSTGRRSAAASASSMAWARPWAPS
jgi:Cu(I)/Ag(I) efflux system membrane protein CusA/SilA